MTLDPFINRYAILIAGFFVLWSFAWACRDDLGRWGLSVSIRVAILTYARVFILVTLFITYIWLDSDAAKIVSLIDRIGAKSWSSAIAIAGVLEALNQSLSGRPLMAVWRSWNRQQVRGRYKDFQAAKNIVAFMNTLSALDQGVLTMLGELSNPKERDARRHELAVGTGDFSDSAKLKLADALLEHYRWSELKDMDLVPRWAAVRERIEDPEPVVDEFVYSCERREIFADDLDKYIRQQFDGRVALISYERMSAESQAETSERRRLVVGARSLILLTGLQAVSADREEIATLIVNSKRMIAAEVPSAKPDVGNKLGTLKLLSVELENIRCFRSLTLDFSENGKFRPWTMLLGDNGLGKTTVLRSIAMALCDPSSATALMGRLPGELLRQQTTHGRIRVRLASPDTSEEIWAETTLVRSSSGIELRQSTSTWFPRELLFVGGYGALRNGFGTQSYPGYSTADAVVSLFDPTATLQNPELALRRIAGVGGNVDRVCRQIESVLLLPENSTQLGTGGLSIKGSWGTFVPMGAVGDGYLATLGWLSDLLGWTFLYRPDFISRKHFRNRVD